MPINNGVTNQKGTPAFYTDTFANRPAFGYAGRVFISTDSGQIFEDTGTAWTLIADAGVGGGTLSSVCLNGNTTASGIVITANGLSSNSMTNTSTTAGSILFAGTSGLQSQDNTNLFWDNTNKYLGIGPTGAPTAPLDIHSSTANVLVQLNATATNNSNLAFLNANVGKWRIGNLYNAGANSFQIFDVLNSTARLTILNTGATTLNGTLSGTSADFTGTLTSGQITIKDGGLTTTGTLNLGSTGGYYINGGTLPAALLFYANSSPWMAITSAGSVGMGTTTPISKLQVVGTGTVVRFGEESGTTGKQMLIGVDSATGRGEIQAVHQGTGNTPLALNPAGGLVAIGTTAVLINESSLAVTSGGNTATFKSTLNGGNPLLVWSSPTTGDNGFVQFGTETSFTARGSITYNRAAGLVVYSTTSDYRLKSEINDFNAIEILKKLKPKQFRIGDAINISYGFIAHELQEYYPQAVTGIKDAINEEGNPIYQGVDYSQLTGLLTKAIQEQQAQIEALTLKVNAL